MRLRGLDAWIEGILQKGMLSVPFSPKYPNRCLSQALLDDALKHDRYTNDSNVATKLKRVFGKDNMKDFNNQAARGWALPPLADCRRQSEQRYGGKWNWHHDVKGMEDRGMRAIRRVRRVRRVRWVRRVNSGSLTFLWSGNITS